MATIDREQQEKWDEIEALMLRRVQIMLDTARQTGYYGRETLILHAQKGVPTHIEVGSNTTCKA